MNTSIEQLPTATSTDLKDIAVDVVRRAMQGGATAAEAIATDGSEFSTVVRLGEVETLKESGSKAVGVRVFFGQRAASTYSSDLTPEGLRQLVDSALTLAKITSEDPFAGIPEPAQLGKLEGELDLYFDDVYSLSNADRIDYARRAEKARSMPTPVSSTPKAAPSTRPSATRCWLTRMASSATTSAPTARFRRCRSRRWKARPCSATTGTRSR